MNTKKNCCPKCNFKGVSNNSGQIVYFGNEYCGKPDCECHKSMNTREDIREHMKREINNVCADCGISANFLTCLKKYGKPPKKLCFDVSTTYLGICDCCGEEKYITEVRDYFYPDFTLLEEVKDFLFNPNKE